MIRTISTLVIIAALAVLMTVPVAASEPVVNKRVMTEDNGTAVLIVEISSTADAIYGVTLVDETGSVTDVFAPKGWAGISSGDRVLFSTVDSPVEAGATVVFRLVTTNKSAPLRVTFRDAKSLIYSGQTI